MNLDELFAHGLGLKDAGHLEEAGAVFLQISRLDPTDDAALTELGRVRADQGEFFDARDALLDAIRINPRNHHALCVLGAVLVSGGLVKEGKAYLDRCLEIAPHMASAHWNRSGANLSLGNWEQGWRDFEYGWTIQKRDMRFPFNLYDGKQQGTVLFWGEQGAGDIFQFSRFLVKRQAQRVIFEVRPEMYRLFKAQTHWAVDELAVGENSGATDAEFDAHYPIMSLPFLRGYTSASIKDPYMVAPGIKEFNLDNSKKKVGYVWSGTANHPNNANRSMPMRYLQPLMEQKWNHYVLQKGEGGPISECADWADTADLLMQFDVLVTVDTGIAHLAGALGIRTFMMVPFVREWRWGDPLEHAETTPWYPSMRIFSQREPGDWEGVISRVKEAIDGI